MSELTGYPSIDKPWLQFYTKDQINATLPECSIYQYIWENNKDYLGNVALNYFDRKITYQEMFSGITAASKAYQALGISEGDIVSVITVTLPETIYTFYGLNRIGAISNMIDPRTSEEGIRSYVSEVNSKIVVVIDAAYERVKNAVKGTDVERIIVLSPADSLPFPKKQIYNLSKRKNRNLYDGAMSWKEFISVGENQVLKEAIYQKNKCCVIVHTGGTTGTPKGVMLSDDNVNCSAFQCYNSSIDFQRNHNWLDIMPPFIAYGVGNGLHLPLVTGAEVVIIPSFNPDKFDDLLKKYHPVHMVGVPSHYAGIVESPKLKKENLSYMICPVVGGDGMPIELEKVVNDFLRQHDCKWNVVKGYGMTEVCAAISVGVSNESNDLGSVGVPFAHTIISVFDPETGKELPYNECGEICMTGPNTMLGYYKNTEETEKILIKHDDGKVWVHSGDLGYMNDKGILFIEGRMKRMLTRHDGFKVFPSLMEKVIGKESHVKNCCVVGKDDTEHSQGKLPVVYVVLRNSEVDRRSVIESINDLCKSELPEYAQPDEIFFIDELPLTPIGKVDYRALEELQTKRV